MIALAHNMFNNNKIFITIYRIENNSFPFFYNRFCYYLRTCPLFVKIWHLVQTSHIDKNISYIQIDPVTFFQSIFLKLTLILLFLFKYIFFIPKQYNQSGMSIEIIGTTGFIRSTFLTCFSFFSETIGSDGGWSCSLLG